MVAETMPVVRKAEMHYPMAAVPRNIVVRRSEARPNTAERSWQVRAIQAYHEATQQELAVLPAVLAAWVAALTDRPVMPDQVYVDKDARAGHLSVEGVHFRLAHDELVVLRKCVSCGNHEYASPPIGTVAELGYALSAWQPTCEQCALNDPEASWD